MNSLKRMTGLAGVLALIKDAGSRTVAMQKPQERSGALSHAPSTWERSLETPLLFYGPQPLLWLLASRAGFPSALKALLGSRGVSYTTALLEVPPPGWR